MCMRLPQPLLFLSHPCGMHEGSEPAAASTFQACEYPPNACAHHLRLGASAEPLEPDKTKGVWHALLAAAELPHSSVVAIGGSGFSAAHTPAQLQL